MSALYTFATRLTNSADEAADLVQDTFLKAYRFFDSFESGTNCKAWLFRILKNAYINEYRRTAKSPKSVSYEEVEEFYDTIRDSSVSSNSLEEHLFDRTLDDDVSAALASLPEEFRQVVILADIEQFTYEEIAEFFDCPIGTVRSRLHRARKLLATKLAEYARQHGWTSQ
jgi:RNA polymerase sigma-70 factor (ECF subfamily)